jgi:hypothetical protein
MTTTRAGARRQTTRCRVLGLCPGVNGGRIGDPGLTEMAGPAEPGPRARMLEHSPPAAAFSIANKCITIRFWRATRGRRDVGLALVCGAGEITP